MLEKFSKISDLTVKHCCNAGAKIAERFVHDRQGPAVYNRFRGKGPSRFVREVLTALSSSGRGRFRRYDAGMVKSFR